MRLTLAAVGRLKAGPERELFDRYLKRLSESARGVGLTGVAAREFGESRARRPEDRRVEEAETILTALPSGGLLVLLDERGAPLTSAEWAADIGRARDASIPAYVVALGGPDGLDPALRERSHRVVAFGAMTWPHQLARVMAAEQLYRAVTILGGKPYHRA